MAILGYFGSLGGFEIFAIIAGAILAFVLLRRFNQWYLGILNMTEILKENNKLLKEIVNKAS